MKNTINILLILLSISFFACEEEATLETIDELVVEALLQVGQTVDSLKFSKVISFEAESEPPKPNDLLPIIKNADGEEFMLLFTGEEGIYGNPDLIIEEGEVYTLEVTYNGHLVSAETYAPSPPANLTSSETLIEMAKITSFQDLQNQTMPDPIEINWEGEDDAYYFVQVKNIEDEPEIVNELFASSGFNRPDFLTEPSTTNFYTINTFRDITHFGRYEVIIYRVNPEYVTLYEDNSSGSEGITEIRTNVQNGFGIFTAVNSEKIVFEVKEL